MPWDGQNPNTAQTSFATAVQNDHTHLSAATTSTDLKSPEGTNAETTLAEKPEIILRRRAKSRSRA